MRKSLVAGYEASIVHKDLKDLVAFVLRLVARRDYTATLGLITT